jgi:hypothetical protein
MIVVHYAEDSTLYLSWFMSSIESGVLTNVENNGVGVFCTDKNRVVKIEHFSSEVVLLTTKHTMIYPG